MCASQFPCAPEVSMIPWKLSGHHSNSIRYQHIRHNVEQQTSEKTSNQMRFLRDIKAPSMQTCSISPVTASHPNTRGNSCREHGCWHHDSFKGPIPHPETTHQPSNNRQKKNLFTLPWQSLRVKYGITAALLRIEVFSWSYKSDCCSSCPPPEGGPNAL